MGVGAWLVGLDIQYDNQHRLCCDNEWKCTGQVRRQRLAGSWGRWLGTPARAAGWKLGAAHHALPPTDLLTRGCAASPSPPPVPPSAPQSNKDNVCLAFNENQCAGLCRAEERLEGIYRDCVADPFSAGARRQRRGAVGVGVRAGLAGCGWGRAWGQASAAAVA